MTTSWYQMPWLSCFISTSKPRNTLDFIHFSFMEHTFPWVCADILIITMESEVYDNMISMLHVDFIGRYIRFHSHSSHVKCFNSSPYSHIGHYHYLTSHAHNFIIFMLHTDVKGRCSFLIPSNRPVFCWSEVISSNHSSDMVWAYWSRRLPIISLFSCSISTSYADALDFIQLSFMEGIFPGVCAVILVRTTPCGQMAMIPLFLCFMSTRGRCTRYPSLFIHIKSFHSSPCSNLGHEYSLALYVHDSMISVLHVDRIGRCINIHWNILIERIFARVISAIWVMTTA